MRCTCSSLKLICRKDPVAVAAGGAAGVAATAGALLLGASAKVVVLAAAAFSLVVAWWILARWRRTHPAPPLICSTCGGAMTGPAPER